MNAVDLLLADHSRFRGQMKRFEEAEEAADEAEMSAIADELFTDLDVHARVEEAEFYEPLRAADEELGDKLDEGEQEHHVIDLLIAECRAMERADEEWVAKVGVLMENVEHHLREEEDDMFPKARRVFSADRLREMGDALDRAKARRGAPTTADTMDLTVDELEEKAREQQIAGRSTMNHDELAAAVNPD